MPANGKADTRSVPRGASFVLSTVFKAPTSLPLFDFPGTDAPAAFEE